MDINELFSLKNKAVLITGGRVRYGRSCSVALCEAGASLYLASHSIEDAKPFVEELNAKGGKCEAIAYDQADPASIKNMVEEVISKAGRIDVFVNASRIMPKDGTGWMQTEIGLDEAIRVNCAAFLYMTSLVGKQMIKQRSGSIINFGSMMGLVGTEVNNYEGAPIMAAGAYMHDYALTKSGIITWSRHAASYYGQYGIRVNTICPGGLWSKMMPEGFVENYSKHTQLGRLADDDDIKGPCLFLASDCSRYVTGVTLPVDGGYTGI